MQEVVSMLFGAKKPKHIPEWFLHGYLEFLTVDSI